MPNATIASRSTGVDDTAASSHTVTKPTGLTSSQGVLVCFTNDVATTAASTSSSGWTQLATQSQGSTTNHTGTVFWAANGAGAADLVVNLTSSEEATWAVLVVSNPGTPEIVGANGSSSTSVGVPTLTTSTTGDYLSVVYVGADSSTTTTQTFTAPSGYANTRSQNPGTTSSAATFTCERSYTAVSSIAPGAATLGSAEQWVAFTVGFPGQASGGGGGGSGGAPTLRSSAAGGKSTASATSFTVTKPTGLTAGDYLIAFQGGDADNTLSGMTPPSGFAAVGSQSPDAANNVPAVEITAKVATATDASASSFTFGSASSGDSAAVLIAITAGTYDTTTPAVLGSFTTQNRPPGTQPQNAPALTGVVNGLLLALFTSDTGGTTQTYPSGSTPSGMAFVDQIQAASNYTLIGAYSQALTSAGSTGTKSVTPTPSVSSNGWSAVQLLVNPAPVTVDTTDFFGSQAV